MMVVQSDVIRELRRKLSISGVLNPRRLTARSIPAPTAVQVWRKASGVKLKGLIAGVEDAVNDGCG